MIAEPCDPSCDHSNAGDAGPCCRAFDGRLPILREPVASSEPSKGALDDPASWQNLEAFRRLGAFDDIQGPAPFPPERSAEFGSGMAAIGEDMAQPGEAMTDGFQKGWRAVPILNVGGVDDHEQHIAQRVGEDMALAALDLLARVVASRPAAFLGFHALAVDHAGARARLAPLHLPRAHHEQMVDRRKQAHIPPRIEVTLHCPHRRKVLRQRPPLAAGRRYVKDRVHHLTQARCSRPAAPLRRWKKRRNQMPFAIQKIAWIAIRTTAMILPSDICPGHVILHLFTKTVNHNLLISLNPFPVRLLRIGCHV